MGRAKREKSAASQDTQGEHTPNDLELPVDPTLKFSTTSQMGIKLLTNGLRRVHTQITAALHTKLWPVYQSHTTAIALSVLPCDITYWPGLSGSTHSSSLWYSFASFHTQIMAFPWEHLPQFLALQNNEPACSHASRPPQVQGSMGLERATQPRELFEIC